MEHVGQPEPETATSPIEHPAAEPTPAERRQQAITGLTTSYEPYDPAAGVLQLRQDLEAIRHQAGDAKSLTAEQRQAQRERTQSERERISAQQIGIARTIEAMYEHSTHHPEATGEDLWGIVTQAAAPNALTQNQLGMFYDGVQEYDRRHQLVRTARASTNDDAQLFQLVFGFAPAGPVRATTGAITLSFECRDPRDFTTIVTEHTRHEDVTTEEAARPQGVATLWPRLQGRTDHPLNGMVVIKNQPEIERAPIRRRGGSIEPHSSVGLVLGSADKFFVNLGQTSIGQTELTVHTYPLDDNGSIRVFMSPDGTPRPNTVFDVLATGEITTVLDDQPHSELTFSSLGGKPIDLRVSPPHLMFTNDSDDPVAYAEGDFADRQYTIHEDMHAYNALFRSLIQPPMPNAITPSFQKGVHQGVLEAIEHLALQQRQPLDKRTENEIIAYLRDGTELNRIRQFLDDPLYNHGAALNNRDHIANAVEADWQKIAKDLPPEAGQIAPDDLRPDQHDVDMIIERVFVADYKKEADRWVGAAQQLLNQYPRNEAISLLYTVPIYQWPALARHHRPSSTSQSPQPDTVEPTKPAST